MPYLHIQTHTPPPDEEYFLAGISKCIADALGKSDDYMMVVLDPVETIRFGGNYAPALFLHLKALDLPVEKLKALAATITAYASEHTNVPGDRIFINFTDVPRSHWSLDGKTFA